MKPPQCDVCGLRFDPTDGGGLVYFADHESLPDGMTGHPQGGEWYCVQHYDAADALSGKTYAKASRTLRRNGGWWTKFRRLIR